MKMKRLGTALAAVAASALVLSGCAAPDREPEIVAGSNVNASWNDPFFAYNSNTSATNASANAVIISTANDGFFHYDPTPAQVMDEQFGKVEKLSDDPLTVKYTINDDVKWSDGTPMDGADLLILWAASTTTRSGDIPQPEYDDEGNVKNQDAIDAASKEAPNWGTYPTPDYGLDLVKEMPKVDGKSMTITYSEPYTDWQFVGDDTELNISAHGTMQLAFPGEYDDNPQAAKDAFVKAVADNDTATLVAFADQYREGYSYTSMPSEPQKTLSNGPYVITNLVENQFVTLTAREDYTWGPKPHYETITVKFIADPQAQVDAIKNGDVDVAAGQPTVDLLQQLEGMSGVQHASSLEGVYEHIDLQVTNGGVFDPATYGGDAEKAKLIRQAFLLTIPRQEIVDKLIVPLAPDATVRESNIFLPGSDGYQKASQETGIDFYNPANVDANIEKAKELLAQAGVENPEVRILTAQSNNRRQQELQLITVAAEKAGFKIVDASAADWSTVLSTQKSSYDAALFGWASTSLAVGESCPNYQATGTNNFYGWDSPRIEELCTELAKTVDADRQTEILIEIEKISYDEAWGLPIFQFPGVVAWSDKVTGVQPGFLSPSFFWNASSWAPAAQ